MENPKDSNVTKFRIEGLRKNIPSGMYRSVENYSYPIPACRRYATLYRTHTWRHAKDCTILFYRAIIPTGFRKQDAYPTACEGLYDSFLPSDNPCGIFFATK